MTINERISEILQNDKHFTQKNMSSSIGAASSTVNNWLKYGRSIPAEYIAPIADYLGISCEFLLTGSEGSIFVSQEDEEWISLLHRLPPDARKSFRDKIEGYLMRVEEESVAAEEAPLKEAK